MQPKDNLNVGTVTRSSAEDVKIWSGEWPARAKCIGVRVRGGEK